jgi:hypothetical protein
MKSVMSLSPFPKPAQAAPAEQAHFFRNPISAGASRVLTETVSFHEDSTERGSTYPMSGIISYAQNREDILLWRALRDYNRNTSFDITKSFGLVPGSDLLHKCRQSGIRELV